MAAKGILKAQDIDGVIDELFNMKVITGDLTSDIIKETYRHVFVILKHGQELKATPLADWRSVTGFDMEIFNNLKFEYSVWKVTELQFIKVLQGNTTIAYDSMIDQMKKLNIDNDLQMLSLSTDQKAVMHQAWNNWLRIVSNYPLIYENGAHLVVPASPTFNTNITSLTLVSALRSLVRFAEMGYGKAAYVGNTDLWGGVFSKAAIQQFENDFEKFGRAVHFLDPRQADSGGLGYMNARYFTFSSNGSELESSQQFLELLALMVSGGKIVADQMMVDLEKDHCLLSQTDPSFNKPVAEQLCFETSFRKNFAQLFSSLTALQKDVSAGHINLDEVIKELEAISRDVAKTPGVIEYPEMRVMAAVLYYMESLMAVFDKNHDQELSMDEILTAYPRFQAMVQQMSPIGSHLDEDAYLYIVYRGQKPVINGIGNAVSAAWDFTGFVIDRNRGVLGQATRLNLLKVIAVLKQQADDAAAAGKRSAPTQQSVQ
jgi:hypothetical protein